MCKNIIRWTDLYSIGYEVIDNQHKKIIEIINRLCNLSCGDRNEEKLLLAEIIDYTVYHFKTEEQILEECNFLYKDMHKKKHRNFIQKVNEFAKLYENNVLKRIDIVEFLGSWLINHILIEDRRYVACLKKIKEIK